MSLKIHIDGQLYDKQDAKISVYDHGFLYGDGVFEGMRSYGGTVFRHRQHLERLWQSARAISLEIPISLDEMERAVNETLNVNDIQDGYIRLIVTRGAGTLGLDPNKTSRPQVIIIADSIVMYPDELYENGLEIVTAKTIRNHPGALSPSIKSLNYLNNILAKIEGLNAGCIEALMLNHNGEVSECTGDNVFLVRDSVVITPPVEAGILQGITRQAVIDILDEMGNAVEQTTILPDDVYQADEVFLTGTAAEVIAVVKVDGRAIGDGKPGPFSREIKQRFHELARGGGN